MWGLIMNKFRNIIIATLTFLSVASTNVININATSYIRGDIDGDGSVTLIDLATMAQFLNGSVSADGTTAERLDVNRDYIINAYDKSIISSILLGDEQIRSITSWNTSNLPNSESRSYREYYPNGTFSGAYILPAVSDISGISIPSRGILGDDDNRTPENSLRGVIRIEKSVNLDDDDEDNDDPNWGTGFVVDDHTILTAAHVLWEDGQTDSIIENLNFVIYDDFNTPSNETITPVKYHIPYNHISNIQTHIKADDFDDDYALVTVEEDLSEYVNFDLGIMRNGIENYKSLYVTGFGGKGGDSSDRENVNEDLINVKSTGQGTIILDPVSPINMIYYNVDTVGGMSGAPLYVYNPDGTRTVIGIHTHRNPGDEHIYNAATRIDTNILNFIFNNNFL